jgi:hypothetical protein
VPAQGIGEFQLPGDPEPAAERPGWPPEARRAVGYAAGCFGLIFLETLAILGFLAMVYFIQPPDGLSAAVRNPARVRAGQKFSLTLVVTNEGDRPFRLDSVVIGAPASRRLKLSDPQPPPQGTMSLGSRSWQYQKQLAPGETWQFRVDAVASEPGEIQGSVEVQANFAIQSAPFKVHVVPAR